MLEQLKSIIAEITPEILKSLQITINQTIVADGPEAAICLTYFFNNK